MPKPSGQPMLPTVGQPQPMPKPNAKPAPQDNMPPPIIPPSNPGYSQQQPAVREIRGPSFAFGVAAPAPSFTQAPEYNAQSVRAPTVGGPELQSFEAKSASAPVIQAAQAGPFQAQQGSVGQIGSSYSPTAITPQ